VDAPRIVPVPTLGEYDSQIDYKIKDALRVGDDSYFHIGLQFTFEVESVVIPFKVKLLPEADLRTYEIVIELHNKKYLAEIMSFDQFSQISEYVFEALKEDLHDSLKRWANDSKLPGEKPYIFYHPYPSEQASGSAGDWSRTEIVPYGIAQRARQWMTTEEAAEYSGYDVEYVRRLVREGKVAAVKKGRSWWVSASSLINYVESMQSREDGRAGPEEDIPHIFIE
jgi:excisionase family DNA binding protein